MGITNEGGVSLKDLNVEYKFEKNTNVYKSIYNTSPTSFQVGSNRPNKYTWKYSVDSFNPGDGFTVSFFIDKNQRIDSVTPRADDFDVNRYWHVYYE